MSGLTSFKDSLLFSLRQKCPRCGEGDLFASRWSLDLQDTCPHCGFDISQNDVADGPAVFLIFLLGFLVVPLALIVAFFVDWPLWLHGVIWTALCLVITLGSLRFLKSYIITLQYKHRPDDWEE